MNDEKITLAGSFKGKAKNSHEAEALVVYCMDFRFQEALDEFIRSLSFSKGADRVVVAGAVKDSELIDKHVELSLKLHHTKKVILINHRTCGAYGPELAQDPDKEMKKHIEDLLATANRIKGKYPELKVECYFADIEEPKDGSSEVVIKRVDF